MSRIAFHERPAVPPQAAYRDARIFPQFSHKDQDTLPRHSKRSAIQPRYYTARTQHIQGSVEHTDSVYYDYFMREKLNA